MGNGLPRKILRITLHSWDYGQRGKDEVHTTMACLSMDFNLSARMVGGGFQYDDLNAEPQTQQCQKYLDVECKADMVEPFGEQIVRWLDAHRPEYRLALVEVLDSDGNHQHSFRISGLRAPS